VNPAERTYVLRDIHAIPHRRSGRLIRVRLHPQGSWFVENANSCTLEDDNTVGEQTTIGGFGGTFNSYGEALAYAESLVADYEATDVRLVAILVEKRP
jgi:hypothetical protein